VAGPGLISIDPVELFWRPKLLVVIDYRLAGLADRQNNSGACHPPLRVSFVDVAVGV